MSQPVLRQRRRLLPDFDELIGTVFPYSWRSLFDQRQVRIEEYAADGHEIIRAELPGMDPEQDIDITVQEGVLTIKAERKEEKSEKGHSEFRYGAFLRRVMLPAGADESDVTASYDKGILTVQVALKQPQLAERHIKVDH